LLALLGTSGVAGDWLSSESVRGRVGAGAAWTLFDGGARRAQVRAAGAGIQAAQANFEKVVAVALEETDTAVWGWGQVRRRNAELTIAQGLGQESARLARIRYQEGAESLLGVLEAERTSLAIEEQLVMSKRDLAALTARCYIAMAGGFDGVDVSGPAP
jgi:multidrug efflux system outer membrane protein